MGMFMERGIMAFADGKSLVSYGLNGYTEKEMERLSGSKKIEIAQSTEHLRNFIDKALSGEIPGKKLLLGRISNDLSQRIQQKTGVNISNYNLELRADEIRHTQKHHGDDKAEAKRGQQAITAEDYANFPNIVTEFDNVTIEKGNCLHFTKDINGLTTVITLYASGNKSLSLKTMRKKIKKCGSAFQAVNAQQTPNHNVLNDLGATVPTINNIGDFSEKVNTTSKKSSKFV
jgi:hypothetical protein